LVDHIEQKASFPHVMKHHDHDEDMTVTKHFYTYKVLLVDIHLLFPTNLEEGYGCTQFID
jgi:hypothetical protein